MATLNTLSVVGIAAASGVVALTLAVVLSILIVRKIHRRRQRLAQQRYRSIEPSASRRKVISKPTPHVQFGSVTYFPDNCSYWSSDIPSSGDLEKGGSSNPSHRDVHCQQHPRRLEDAPSQELASVEQPVLVSPHATLTEELPLPEDSGGTREDRSYDTRGTTSRLCRNSEADRPSTAPPNNSEGDYACHCRTSCARHKPQSSWSSNMSASAPPKAPPPAVPSWALQMRKSLPLLVSRMPSHDSLASVDSSGSSIIKRAMSPSMKASAEFAERNPDIGLGVQLRDIDTDIKNAIMSGNGKIPAQSFTRPRSRSPTKRAASYRQQALIRQASTSSNSHHKYCMSSGNTSIKNARTNGVPSNNNCPAEVTSAPVRNSTSSTYSSQSVCHRSTEEIDKKVENVEDKATSAVVSMPNETCDRLTGVDDRGTQNPPPQGYSEAVSGEPCKSFVGKSQSTRSTPIPGRCLSFTRPVAGNEYVNVTDISHQCPEEEDGHFPSARVKDSAVISKEYRNSTGSASHSPQIKDTICTSFHSNAKPSICVAPLRISKSIVTPQKLGSEDQPNLESTHYNTQSLESRACGSETKIVTSEHLDYRYPPITSYSSVKLGNPMQNRPDLRPSTQPYGYRPRPYDQPRQRAVQSVEMTICSLRHMASRSSTASVASSLQMPSPDQLSHDRVLRSPGFDLKGYGLTGSGKGAWNWGSILVGKRQPRDENLADEGVIEQAWGRLGAQSRGSLYDEDGFLRQDK